MPRSQCALCTGIRACSVSVHTHCHDMGRDVCGPVRIQGAGCSALEFPALCVHGTTRHWFAIPFVISVSVGTISSMRQSGGTVGKPWMERFTCSVMGSLLCGCDRIPSAPLGPGGQWASFLPDAVRGKLFEILRWNVLRVASWPPCSVVTTGCALHYRGLEMS